MAYEVFFASKAKRTLKRLPVDVQSKITRALKPLEDDPRPSGSIKLKGTENTYRIRVGDYRVAYTIKDYALIVVVIGLGHRKDIYEKLSPE